MDLKGINNCLENNLVPFCLDYTLQEKSCIDYNKLNYTDFWDKEYYARKLPDGYEYIAGFDKVIENIANIQFENKNTLEIELNKIKNLNLNNGINTNIFKLN